MPDLEKRAITRYGLSFSEFWDSTPREVELLMERSDYSAQLGMNQVRHIMAAVINGYVDRKVKPKGVSAKELVPLPLIDGKNIAASDLKAEQEKLKEVLERVKKRKW